MIHTLISNRFNEEKNLIFLATSTNNIPSIRALTPYYENGVFYFLTNQQSNKVNQLLDNPHVALCGSWFNSAGLAKSLGCFKNVPKDLKNKLIQYCQSWITLGNVNIDSEDTIVIAIDLTKGYIVDKDKRYEFDYS